MRAIREHLALQNPRFVCKDAYEVGELSVPLSNDVGAPASRLQLEQLRELAGPAFDTLAPLYEAFNGLGFHVNADTAGLFVAPIEQLAELNRDWREWFSDIAPADLYEFQRHGFAFATIVASANYFVVFRGRIYYSDHDGGDDAVWGEDLERFFSRALSDPPRFLYEAGCYTRYSDGETDAQLIPERFVHD